jgi:hypothetical protein
MKPALGLRRQSIKLVFVAVAIAVLAGSVLFSLVLHYQAVYPRHLQVGDRWVYSIVFPDSHGYTLSETVQEKSVWNGTETYVVSDDDAQHISMSYMWITTDWYEIRTSKPSIGNLGVSSVTTYEPPIQLIHIPLRIGDEWEANSNATTVTYFGSRTLASTLEIRQTRQTISSERVQTLVGNFQTFKISVLSRNSPFETLWFSSNLGQVVYAKFYNPLGEAVIETLIGYVLNESTSTGGSAYQAPLVSNDTSAGNVAQVIFAASSTLLGELKIPYE